MFRIKFADGWGMLRINFFIEEDQPCYMIRLIAEIFKLTKKHSIKDWMHATFGLYIYVNYILLVFCVFFFEKFFLQYHQSKTVRVHIRPDLCPA